MKRSQSPADRDGAVNVALGPALRSAWVGYQRRLDQEMGAAGFGDRRFPDGRVLRMCRYSVDATISDIGRELGISRQGAGKIVSNLRERGYVFVQPSPKSGREKIVTLTPRALEYLAAQRTAVRKIEKQLRASLGPDAFSNLHRLLEVLGDEQLRLREYLRRQGVREL